MSGSMLQHAAFKASISSEVASGLLGGVATEMSGNMLYARSLQGIDIVVSGLGRGSWRGVAGTWEEKSLNSWALARVKELLLSADTVSFPQGTARVIEVSSCTGDATLVTVRKKKRVGYSFEITIKFNGEITSSGEPKNLEGSVKLLEAAYGELDDLQVEVTLKDRTVPANEKSRVSDAIGKSFLPVLRQQLALFEAELEER
ncbi:hypothetical protein AXG93_1231s1170 [Marchantia polymorpha subsp. ruderalis]|uniref:Activator of Hsp90 ATPase AHSA1-like N-terminal domain-containing protein n=1 Tax=Marchantia polymorpha subsp. ruderalis TaxID=1480154 RepID=A0A176VQ35_MARPO|nr:hypothetical protein AXG93_1231s1170 [Marchantia polymorpha subsp. ruderalis]